MSRHSGITVHKKNTLVLILNKFTKCVSAIEIITQDFVNISYKSHMQAKFCCLV